MAFVLITDSVTADVLHHDNFHFRRQILLTSTAGPRGFSNHVANMEYSHLELDCIFSGLTEYLLSLTPKF